MARTSLSALLRLPSEERVELAMALWDSLTEAEREAEFRLTPEQEAELDRRWSEHLANPDSGVSWDQLQRKLLGGS